jgi:hypothetical protein
LPQGGPGGAPIQAKRRPQALNLREDSNEQFSQQALAQVKQLKQGQPAVASASKPKTGYIQTPFSASKLFVISRLFQVLHGRPSRLEVVGMVRETGDGTVVKQLLGEDKEKRGNSLGQLQQKTEESWSQNDSKTVAAAFVEAFKGVRPFSEEGHRKFLKAGDKSETLTREERVALLKEAVDELPEGDRQAIRLLAEFTHELIQAQANIRSLSKEDVASLIALSLTNGFHLKETPQTIGALLLLSEGENLHKIFPESSPRTPPESSLALPQPPKNKRPTGVRGLG